MHIEYRVNQRISPEQFVSVLRRSTLNVLHGGEQRKVMADQLTTFDKGRLHEHLGNLSAADLLGVERAIRTQLGLG